MSLRETTAILSEIGERIREGMEEKNHAREIALERSRHLIRFCATAIQAVHRGDWETAELHLAEAEKVATELLAETEAHPDIRSAGYTQDALKEYAEARLTYAFVRDIAPPSPSEILVDGAAYLNGLAEAASELRRSILDLIRRDQFSEAERLLALMDGVYGLLVTFDFPDMISGGLRRRVDSMRMVLERTRGDLTVALRQQNLQEALRRLESRLREDER